MMQKKANPGKLIAEDVVGMRDEEYGGFERQNESSALFWFFIISGICHILITVGLIFLPDFLPKTRIYQPSSLMVDLVSLPGPPPKAEKPGPVKKSVAAPPPEVKKPEPVVKEPETPKPQLPPETEKPKEVVKEEEPLVPVEDAEISVATKKPEKQEKPKEISKPQQVTEKPKAQKTDVIDKKAQKNLQNALERLKKKAKGLEDVRSRIKEDDAPDEPDEPSGGHPSGVEGGTGGGGGGQGNLPDYYIAQLRYQIEKNWSYPESLAGSSQTKIQAIVNVRVMPSGEIQEVWFERRSGNKFLDESAHKAVMKSNPLPPPPKGYKEYVFGFIFTPKGLK